jgi:hypothetical protein
MFNTDHAARLMRARVCIAHRLSQCAHRVDLEMSADGTDILCRDRYHVDGAQRSHYKRIPLF